MEIETYFIQGVVSLRPKRHQDSRGYFSEVFNHRIFRERVEDVDFVQDNQSLSVQAGTIRGLHFQRNPRAQGKLVRVIAGAIIDVAVDIRHGSPTFGKHVAVRLDSTLGAQLWIPAGFAHGFCTLEPNSCIAYKVTDYFSSEHDGGIIWDDPAIGIKWPELPGGPVLSDKDLKLPKLADLPELFSISTTKAN